MKPEAKALFKNRNTETAFRPVLASQNQQGGHCRALGLQTPASCHHEPLLCPVGQGRVTCTRMSCVASLAPQERGRDGWEPSMAWGLVEGKGLAWGRGALAREGLAWRLAWGSAGLGSDPGTDSGSPSGTDSRRGSADPWLLEHTPPPHPLHSSLQRVTARQGTRASPGPWASGFEVKQACGHGLVGQHRPVRPRCSLRCRINSIESHHNPSGDAGYQHMVNFPFPMSTATQMLWVFYKLPMIRTLPQF